MKNELTISGNEITIGNKSVMLPRIQMIIFKKLLKSKGRVLTFKYLMVVAMVNERHALDVRISRLRESLSVFKGVNIVTQLNEGYALKAKCDQVKKEKRWMYVSDEDLFSCEIYGRAVDLFQDKPAEKEDFQIVKIEAVVK